MEIEKIKLIFACIAFGAFAMFGIGFGLGGWVLGDTAVDRADAAVIERLTPICVAQFKRDPAMDRKIQTLRKLAYSKQGKFVADQGWATMPGDKQPDNVLAEKCGDQITD